MEEKPREERVLEMKKLLEKDKGREFSIQEADEALRNLEGLAGILFEHWLEDKRRKKKLEESPKGFHLEGRGYTCFVCGNSASEQDSWYDKYGIKCMTCQRAIDRKEIPATLAKNKDSWYSTWEIGDRFNVKGTTLRSWVKKGILKERVIKDDNGNVHARLFLIKDNKDTLPPKELVKSQTVKEVKDDGEVWYKSHPWYHFGDPYEHLKGYKIMDYLRLVENKEEK